MQEKTLLLISVLVALSGLALLYFSAGEVNTKAVETIETTPVAKQVQVQGILEKVNHQGNTYFLQLRGEKVETMDIIIFPEEDLFLKEGASAEIEGQVQEYKGKKEIIASKVTIK